MNIQLPLETDSYNSEPHGHTLDIRRGNNRPANAVVVIGDRQVEVNMQDLFNAVKTLVGENQ